MNEQPAVSLVAAARLRAAMRHGRGTGGDADTDDSRAEGAAPRSVTVVELPALLVNDETLRLAHPWPLLLAGMCIFLSGVFFPPQAYTQLLGDQCHMFLDAKLITFNLASVAMILAGIYVAGCTSAFGPPPQTSSENVYRPYPWTVGGFLVVLILMNLVSVYLFYRVGGIGSLLAALRGQVLFMTEMTKMKGTAGGEPWKAVLNVSSIALPAAWQCSRSFSRHSLIRVLLIVCILTYIPAALLTAKRNFLTRPLLGALLVYLVWPLARRKVSGRQALMTCLLLGVLVVVAFLGMSALRKGISGTTEATAEVIRYVIGPYNTEALIVNDEMEVPGSRKGFYWTRWFWEFPVADQYFELDRLRDRVLGEKAPYGTEERAPVLRKHGLTVTTAMPGFASTYVDFGWLGICAYFFVGLAAGGLWKSFLAQQPAGLLFYPVAAYSFVDCRANLIFPSIFTSYCLLVYVVMKFSMTFEGIATRNRSSGSLAA
ncbi:MAG: hypothetical protein R3C19_18045 [Planctomycetaceae bacterium]